MFCGFNQDSWGPCNGPPWERHTSEANLAESCRSPLQGGLLAPGRKVAFLHHLLYSAHFGPLLFHMSTSSVAYNVPEELNDPNGDIILRSSDEVEFRVFRWPLQQLYPVFSDMFHLPDPSSASPPSESSAPPTAQMSETATVVEALLRLSYPGEPPVIKDLGTATLIIEALIKLRAERRCKWWIRMTAGNLIPTNPWAMYAILLALGRKSCNYNFEEEIRIAARGTVGRPVIRPWNEASLITAADYDRLLIYHLECKNALETQEEIWEKAGLQWPWFGSHCLSGRVITVGGVNVNVTRWFEGFRSKAEEAVLKELRGEVVEDASLWYDSLDKDQQDGEICPKCVKASISQMPAYTKALARLLEEAISQVSRSFSLTKAHRMLILGG